MTTTKATAALIARLREVRPTHLGILLTPREVAIVLRALDASALPPMPTNLTPHQTRVLRAFAAAVERDGVNPTMLQLAGVFGVSKTTIHETFGSLERKGCLRREKHKARGYTLIVAVPTGEDA